jgi:protocatechuate 3,4-dioxygenase beta subunit
LTLPEQENEGGPDPRGGGISRRAALAAMGGAGLGVAGAAILAGTGDAATAPASAGATPARPACTLAPELTAGPYYLDLEMVRRDITESYPGVPLVLRATVVDATRCTPIRDAALDIWHCNAIGEYSGYTAMGPGGANGPGGGGTPPTAPPPGGGGGGGHVEPTDDLTFLRGVQLTDARGRTEFRTLYPGWYVGRAVHIHAKVHVGGTVSGSTYTGGHVSHVGQFFFAEEVTEQIATVDPYSSNPTTRTPLAEDHIYRSGGSAGLLTLTPLGGRNGSLKDGVLATIVVGVDPAATPDSGAAATTSARAADE